MNKNISKKTKFFVNLLLKRTIFSLFVFFSPFECEENIFLPPFTSFASLGGIENSIDGENNSSDENNIDGNNNTNDLQIRDSLSDEARNIFDSIDKKEFDDDTRKTLNSLNKHLERVYPSPEERTKFSDLSTLNLLIEKKIIKNNMNNAQKIVDNIQSEYLPQMKRRYTDEQYDSMIKNSYDFESQGKHAQYCAPENVMISFEGKVLNDFPIIYNDCILISLNDVINLINKNYEIEYMRYNSNIIIKFEKNILEISPGGFEIYINDTRQILDNPVLYYKNRTFISTNVFDYLDDSMNNESLRTIKLTNGTLNERRIMIF